MYSTHYSTCPISNLDSLLDGRYISQFPEFKQNINVPVHHLHEYECSLLIFLNVFSSPCHEFKMRLHVELTHKRTEEAETLVVIHSHTAVYWEHIQTSPTLTDSSLSILISTGSFNRVQVH